MFKRHNENDSDSRPLFTTEIKGSVAVVTFCNRARDLLGMNLSAIDPLWGFFSEQERHPSKVIVFHLPASALGPESMDRILRTHDIQCNGHAHGKYSFDETDFVKQMNVMERLVQAIRNTEALVVVTLSGHMVTPLLGPVLACDYRIAADDFTLVNRMVDYSVIPLGGMPWFLAQMVGKKQADELIRQENAMDAEEALKLGLVEKVVSSDSLLDAAVTWAQEMAERPYGNREALKQTAIAASDSLDEYLAREQKLFSLSVAKQHSSNRSGEDQMA